MEGVEDLLLSLEDAFNHPWMQNRPAHAQYLELCDPDGDPISALNRAETLAAIEAIRGLLA